MYTPGRKFDYTRFLEATEPIASFRLEIERRRSLEQAPRPVLWLRALFGFLFVWLGGMLYIAGGIPIMLGAVAFTHMFGKLKGYPDLVGITMLPLIALWCAYYVRIMSRFIMAASYVLIMDALAQFRFADLVGLLRQALTVVQSDIAVARLWFRA